MKTEIGPEPRYKSATRGKRRSASKVRALVVEDTPSMRVVIEEAFGAAEIRPVTFVTSLNAEARFQHEKFDMILVDVCAPPEDGRSLVRKIRDSGYNRNTPIIMISDDPRPGALSEGFAAGASFFVFKPMDKARLMGLIRVTQGTIENEMRRFRRVTVRVRVQILSDGKTVEGETINLSLNGTLVRAARVLDLGSKVEVSFYLVPGTDPVVGKGAVTRIGEDNQMGIQIVGLPIAESGRLQEYLLPFISD